jgi:hypothetical protein
MSGGHRWHARGHGGHGLAAAHMSTAAPAAAVPAYPAIEAWARPAARRAPPPVGAPPPARVAWTTLPAPQLAAGAAPAPAHGAAARRARRARRVRDCRIPAAHGRAALGSRPGLWFPRNEAVRLFRSVARVR